MVIRFNNMCLSMVEPFFPGRLDILPPIGGLLWWPGRLEVPKPPLPSLSRLGLLLICIQQSHGYSIYQGDNCELGMTLFLAFSYLYPAASYPDSGAFISSKACGLQKL